MRCMAMGFLLCAIGMIAPGPVAAQAGARFGMFGGASSPAADFREVAVAGFHAGGGVEVVSGTQWSLGLDVAYHAWKGSDELNAETSGLLASRTGWAVVADVSWSAIQVTPQLIAELPAAGGVTPFVKLGLGLYSVNLNVDTNLLGSDAKAKSEFGFNSGMGAKLRASSSTQIGIFIEYHGIASKDDFGGNLTFVSFGARASWGGGD